MRSQETRSGDRASRSAALASPYALFFGLPPKARKAAKALPARAASTLRKAKEFGSRAVAPLRAKHSKHPARVALVARVADAAEQSHFESQAALSERQRFGAIVRRGVELGVVEFAAAIAADSNIPESDAVRIVEDLAALGEQRTPRAFNRSPGADAQSRLAAQIIAAGKVRRGEQ